MTARPATATAPHPHRTSRSVTERITALYGDTQACAAAAGLIYVSDDEPGISRRKRGTGFSYRDAANQALTNAEAKARIVALAVPPAWTDVWICPDENGHIMAVGHDQRGRKQYIYHEKWRALRDLLNFYRLLNFGEHLPVVRAHVDQQLRRRTLDRDQVISAMLRIIDTSAVRIGNEVYAEENDSFGLTTLTKKHVEVSGRRIRFTFPAKSGQAADLTIDDAAVARVITTLEQHRRRRLFTVDGQVIDSSEVNALLADLTGEHITAKDFRTWKATVTAFAVLSEHPDPAAKDREHLVLEAVDAAADALSNTRTVARAHYVHPHVLESYLDGTFAQQLRSIRPSRRPGLELIERRLLAFLDALLAQHFNAIPEPETE